MILDIPPLLTAPFGSHYNLGHYMDKSLIIFGILAGSLDTCSIGYNSQTISNLSGVNNALASSDFTRFSNWQSITSLPIAMHGSSNGKDTTYDGAAYFFGGYTSTTVNTCYKYIFEEDRYVQLANYPINAYVVQATSDNAGKFYCFGYSNGTNLFSNSYVYDVTLNTFTAIANTPVAASATFYDTDNNCIYLYGSFTPNGTITYNTNVYKYDISLNTYTLIGTTNLREQLGVQVNGKIYLIGGINSSSNYQSSVYSTSLGGTTYTTLASCPSNITNHSNYFVYKHYIYVMLGFNGTSSSTSTYCYNTITNVWTSSSIGVTPISSYSRQMGTYKGRVYIFGGWNGSSIANAYSTRLQTPDIISISCWVKRNSNPTGNASIFSLKNSGANTGMVLYSRTSTGNYSLQDFASSLESTSTATTTSALGKWEHLVCIYKDSFYYLYINGVLKAQSTVAVPITISGNLQITAFGLGTAASSFPGYISDFNIYYDLLSEDNIKTLYKKGMRTVTGKKISNVAMYDGCFYDIKPIRSWTGRSGSFVNSMYSLINGSTYTTGLVYTSVGDPTYDISIGDGPAKLFALGSIYDYTKPFAIAGKVILNTSSGGEKKSIIGKLSAFEIWFQGGNLFANMGGTTISFPYDTNGPNSNGKNNFVFTGTPSTGLKFYLNGSLKASSGAYTGVNNANNIYLFGQQASDNYTAGGSVYINNIYLYNKELPIEQIMMIYNYGYTVMGNVSYSNL